MREMFCTIANIFRYIWFTLNFIRTFILNFLVIVIFIFIGEFLFKSVNHHITIIPINKGALKLNIRGVIVDKIPDNSYMNKIIEEQILGKIHKKYSIRQNLLFDIVEAIRQAKYDKNITGIVLDLHDFLGTDQVSLQYIGKTLGEFRASGKPIYAIGNSYNQSQYYLASFANKIYLSHAGSVDLRGFATNQLYYNKLLKKLKINSYVFRVGMYKSAVEPFLLDRMSNKIREIDNRWINKLWDNYLYKVSYNRNVNIQQIFPGASKIIEELKVLNGDTAKYSLNNKLVDFVASSSSTGKQLAKIFGLNTKTNEYNNTNIYTYIAKMNRKNKKANIAVIMVNGPIIYNKIRSNNVVGNNIVQHIKHARLDPNIKAVVLYINSPGGSVIASEAIRQELLALHHDKKPIVVSMGSIAASGGYWISTPADYIIAHPSTLTGSIGIFGIINTVENSLDTIGIHADGVHSSPLAKVFNTQRLPIEIQQIMQINVTNGYDKFVNLVAKSRKKTYKQIDDIAQGRVWIGSDAKKNGLVDALGDFDDAVKKAQDLAKITKPKLIWYQDNSKLISLMLRNASKNILFDLLSNWLSLPLVDTIFNINNQTSILDDLNDPQHRYALCLVCNTVKQ
ncbi:signal peptide peptidase SppA [Candidatus Pantoea edessiphila]|uniref:Signal peptide peptidase SppA n=1 Tax=Candidatus Pantoea edessiphila TaxID=2044610 RepID=A0A2P5T0R3_9GAMM|nr:signal peptide peptidase SppA [Candidatus Pantoea edessiphila]PPI88171.1 signal peptide peptidase SppA [Candidatus Pantoea edessiphila]